MSYHAFISYSHAADDQLAPALQQALQRIAKPVFQARALNVFRDETSLSATPHLWSKIEEALKKSDHLILLASPLAAQSPWVEKEVVFWLQHKSINTILIGLTEGEVCWDNELEDFNWEITNALPRVLQGKFSMEPLYVDFRDAKKSEDLSLRNPDFQKNAARLAAPLHQLPLEDLIGEDIRLHQRTMRYRNIAIAALAVLLIATLGFAWSSNSQQKKAELSLSYFFKNDENQAAWAYDNASQRFGVINREGELQGEGFVWEDPQEFEEGVSIAERDNSFWFLDRSGNTISDSYGFVHKTNTEAMYCFDNEDNRNSIGVSRQGKPLLSLFMSIIELPLSSSIQGDSIPNFLHLRETTEFPDFASISLFSKSEFLLIKERSTEGRFLLNYLPPKLSSESWSIYNEKTRKETTFPFDYLPIDSVYNSETLAGISRTIYDWENKRIGFLAVDLKPIFPACEMINKFSDGRAAAKKEGKWGYIDLTGKWIIPPIYQSAETFAEGVAIVGLAGKKGLVDTAGQVLIRPQFSCFEPFVEGYALVSYDGECVEAGSRGYKEVGHWGFVNVRGEMVLEPVYTEIEVFYNGIANLDLNEKAFTAVQENDSLRLLELGRVVGRLGNNHFKVSDKFGSQRIFNLTGEEINEIYNLAGEQVDTYPYNYINEEKEGRILVESYDNYGYLDTSLQEVIPIQYWGANDFSEGLAAVEFMPDEWGYIDQDGRGAISGNYQEAKKFRQGFAFVRIGKDWICIDHNGEQQQLGLEIAPLREELNKLFFKFEDTYHNVGVVGPDGKIIITPKYDSVLNLFDHYFIVELNGKWGIIDAYEQEILPVVFDDIYGWSEGFFVVQEGAIFTYYDGCFEQQFQVGGSYASPFYKQTALYDGEQSSYFINKKGDTLAEVAAIYNDQYKDGFVKFQRAGKYGFLNHENEEVILPEYDFLFDFSGGYAIFNNGGQLVREDDNWERNPYYIKGGTWGFVDEEGKEIEVPQVNLMRRFSHGLSEVEAGSRDTFSFAFVDVKGKIVSPLFDFIEENYLENNSPVIGVGVLEDKGSLAFAFWHKDGYYITDTFYSQGTHDFQFGHGIVQQEMKLGLINELGEKILSTSYKNIEKIGFNLYKLQQGNKVGFAALTGYGAINYHSGQLVELKRYLACDYEAIGTTYTDDWLAVKQNGKWGFVHWEPDTEGSDQAVLRIPCKYDAVTPFIDFPDGNRYARVYIEQYDLEFWVNEAGEMLVEAIYDFAY